MTPEELIASGQLELYVSGSLTAEEVNKVNAAMQKNPEVKEEIKKIEISLIQLAQAASPALSERIWEQILLAIQRPATSEGDTRTNWSSIIGWAAAVAAVAGIFWMMNQNANLEEELQIVQQEKIQLEQDMITAETQLADSQEILEILRSKEYNTYNLPGNQAVAPQAYAKIYYNSDDAVAYIDTNGLPEAPREKTYQVWSLIMEPLTPTSMGLISSSNEVASGIFRFDNVPPPEAIGITLEPAGGSEGPTLSQLYILGQVGQ